MALPRPLPSRSTRVVVTNLALLVLAVANPAESQDRRNTMADYQYDRAIPTLAQVVGHDPGEEVSSPEEIARYVTAIQ